MLKLLFCPYVNVSSCILIILIIFIYIFLILMNSLVYNLFYLSNIFSHLTNNKYSKIIISKKIYRD